MKRLALLSLAALMLAATTFAPAAMAQEPGDVEFQSAMLAAGGIAVLLNGTIQCTEGYRYQIDAQAWQTTGNQPYNIGSGFYGEGACQTTGPETFTVTVIGERAYKKGTVLVREATTWCAPLLNTSSVPFPPFKS